MATVARSRTLERLTSGMPLVYGGNQVAYVDEALAETFRPGDRLLVVQETGALLHIPQKQHDLAALAVEQAAGAFADLQALPDERIDRFYDELGARLENNAVWEHVARANADDVARAQARGRSTTRLVANKAMRRRMLAGVAQWRALNSGRGRVVDTIRHEGWQVEQVVDGLGVVGFVFEGRPNVLTDATGILRTGNTTALRIGSDALGTAKAMMAMVVTPSLSAAGLPAGSVTLLDSAEHSAGWALFSHAGLALAIARGSGPAVAQLGAIARQTGIPVSLHGAGGAWLVADQTADPDYLGQVVFHSLDRKVCNTLNTACLIKESADRLAPACLAALESRGKSLGHGYKLHVTRRAMAFVPPELFTRRATMWRAGGPVDESPAEVIGGDALGHEWEWEATPEMTLEVVDSIDEAVQLFNQQSPRFVASLVSDDLEAHRRFFRAIDSPFVGNGTTRWVDGQFALDRPELGLTNWQRGRLFGRGGILTGDGVYSLRLRAWQTTPELRQ